MHQIKFCFFERSDDEEKTITKLPLPFHLHNYSILASIHPNENPKTILVTYLIMEVCNLETNVLLKINGFKNDETNIFSSKESLKWPSF